VAPAPITAAQERYRDCRAAVAESIQKTKTATAQK